MVPVADQPSIELQTFCRKLRPRAVEQRLGPLRVSRGSGKQGGDERRCCQSLCHCRKEHASKTGKAAKRGIQTNYANLTHACLRGGLRQP